MGTDRDDLYEACQPYIRELNFYNKVIYNQARIQRGGGGARGTRPPVFAPNSFKSPQNWPKYA